MDEQSLLAAMQSMAGPGQTVHAEDARQMLQSINEANQQRYSDADWLVRQDRSQRAGFLRSLGVHLPNPQSNSLNRSEASTLEERNRVVSVAQRLVEAFRAGEELQLELSDEDVEEGYAHVPRPGQMFSMDDFAAKLPVGTSLRTFTPEQVREERDQQAKRIFDNYELLKGILERHESTIQKRWKKKSVEQKRNIITAAWKQGSMAKMHRPDFASLQKQGSRQARASRRYRASFIWPFINQEDLTRPRALLQFMNSRGRNAPSAFAAADLQAIRTGVACDTVKPVLLDEHVMIFTGRNDRDSYGELLHCDDHPQARSWIAQRRHMTPGEGLLVLESQDKILEFLVECAKLSKVTSSSLSKLFVYVLTYGKATLHDVEDTALLQGSVQPEPVAADPRPGDAISWALLAAEAPYRVPSSLSFAHIQALLKAKRDAVEDHIWSMREDPGYFAGVLQDGWHHRQEHIKDRNDHPHPVLRFGHDDVLWGRVISDEVTGAFVQLEHWSELYRQAKELTNLQEKHSPNIGFGNDLPEEYLHAILRFRYLFEDFRHAPLGQLKVSVSASPNCRHFFIREAHNNPKSVENNVSLKTTRSIENVEFDFFWLLKTLWDDDSKLDQLNFSHLLFELQRLFEEQKVKDLVSSYVASQISDLAIIAECLDQLHTYQPWANMFDAQMAERKKAIESEVAQITRAWDRLLDARKDSDSVLERYGSPTNERFYYPVAKRRTRENVEAMRQAEQNLDSFWHKVDELTHRNADNLEGTATRKLMLQPRSLQRTAEWVEPKKDTQSKDLPAQTLTKPLSELYFDLQKRTEQTADQSTSTRQPKTKAKTRGEPIVVVPEEAARVDDVAPTETRSRFEVDARALKVFRTLFHTPSASSTPGEVKWDDFLWAMTSASFRPEKLYGSVWQFAPTKLDVETPIQFHEPHGSMHNKIPFYVARRHGRRLNRNYGFHGDMFSLAEKKTP